MKVTSIRTSFFLENNEYITSSDNKYIQMTGSDETDEYVIGIYHSHEFQHVAINMTIKYVTKIQTLGLGNRTRLLLCGRLK